MTENPIQKFSKWFEEAKNHKLVKDHTEMCLATADEKGRPSARIVLLKNFDERGFVFYTNYSGRKSLELEKNPHAALCFYWPALDKQIRIEGKIKKVSAKESDEYFNSRPRESRIGAITSKQSQKLLSREILMKELEKNTRKFEGKEIPRPDGWGGWRLIPNYIEFWCAGEFRIHNREVFDLQKGKWSKKLLYP